MAGETDLKVLLANLQPELDPIIYTFSTQPGPDPLMVFQEREGPTYILAHAGSNDPAFRRIILTIHSSLTAVGLTAAVSAWLAGRGIAANFVSAFHHDHLFVPVADGTKAMVALRQLTRKFSC